MAVAPIVHLQQAQVGQVVAVLALSAELAGLLVLLTPVAVGAAAKIFLAVPVS